MGNSHSKQIKWLVSAIWLAIAIVSGYYLFQGLRGLQLPDFAILQGSQHTSWWLLLGLMLLLMLSNWGLEALKWKWVIQDTESTSFTKSLAATFAGVSISSWMPNRMGEYLGKVFYLQSSNRMKGAISALLVSYSQLVATLLFAAVGGIYVLSRFGNAFMKGYYEVAFLLGALCLLLLYLVLKQKVSLLKMRGLSRKLRYMVIVFTRFSWQMHWGLIGLSALRFLVFTGQFLLALHLAGAQVPWVEVFMLVSVMYGLQTIIPASALASMSLRGSLALWILGNVISNDAAILTASYGVWVVNILLPSAVGVICLLQAPARHELWQSAKTRIAFWIPR